jgi:hypothetical protein
MDWVETESIWCINLLYQPRMIDEYGTFGGMRIGRGNGIYLWLYSPLLVLGRFFSFLILFTQSVELLGRGISQ